MSHEGRRPDRILDEGAPANRRGRGRGRRAVGPASRRRRHGRSACLSIDQLETRTLLSASPIVGPMPAPAQETLNLQLQPGSSGEVSALMPMIAAEGGSVLPTTISGLYTVQVPTVDATPLAAALSASPVVAFAGESMTVQDLTVPTTPTPTPTSTTPTPASPTPTPTPTSAPPPTIIGERVVTTRKTNKKGKPVGEPVIVGFALEYSTAMDPATAGLAANDRVDAAASKHVKKKTELVLQPVAFTAAYDAATETVTMTIRGKQEFARGGQVSIVASSTGGSGVPVEASDNEFTILPRAKGSVPG